MVNAAYYNVCVCVRVFCFLSDLVANCRSNDAATEHGTSGTGIQQRTPIPYPRAHPVQPAATGIAVVDQAEPELFPAGAEERIACQ